MTRKDFLYYSTNTWLAFKISEQYYNDIHYVWCCPFFNGHGKNPPSSNPVDIYHKLNEDINGKDLHSAKIQQNKASLMRSAIIKREQGIITAKEEQDIINIVNAATFEDFRPLIYIIPYDGVKNSIKRADLSSRASAFSEEYLIESMPRSCFDIITLERSIKNV